MCLPTDISLKCLPAFNGDHHRPVLVHDIHRAEIPSIDLNGFAMIGRSISLALIQGICFHQVAIGNMLLQGFHHVSRQYIRTVRLAGVQLDACFACDILVDPGVGRQQSVDTDILRKKYLGFVILSGKSAAQHFKIACGNSTQRNCAAILQKPATRNLLFSPGFSSCPIKGNFIGV